MRYEYTPLQYIKDLCMIYEGSWPIKYWNFTEYKHTCLRFMSIEEDSHWDHPRINFEICDEKHFRAIRNIMDWASFIKYCEKIVGRQVLDAEIVVKDRKNGQQMILYFTGSINRPEEEKCINFNLDYCDVNYHKWKRDVRWFFLNLKCRITRIFKKWY